MNETSPEVFITLAGQKYPVRPMPISLAKMAVPALGRIQKIAPQMQNAEDITWLTTDVFEDMTTIIHMGLMSGGTQISRDGVQALVVPLSELVDATFAIVPLTGLSVKKGAAPTPGEAEASISNTSTSTPSSHES